MIDLHAHILAGLDDGPANLDESAALAATAVAAGTRVMAATSHVNRGFDLQPADLAAARERVIERLAAEGIPLEVVQGGEVSLSRVAGLDGGALRALTLGGGRWLLLECPLSPIAPSMEPAVAALQARGLRVLLAHPERSPHFMRGPDALERLVSAGALAQVTAGSFGGDFGEHVRRSAFAMLERGLVHVIASDAHHPHHRPPDLRPGLEALEGRYEDGEAQFEWMAVRAPRAILDGEPPPERPQAPKPRGGLLRRWRA